MSSDWKSQEDAFFGDDNTESLGVPSQPRRRQRVCLPVSQNGKVVNFDYIEKRKQQTLKRNNEGNQQREIAGNSRSGNRSNGIADFHNQMSQLGNRIQRRTTQALGRLNETINNNINNNEATYHRNDQHDRTNHANRHVPVDDSRQTQRVRQRGISNFVEDFLSRPPGFLSETLGVGSFCVVCGDNIRGRYTYRPFFPEEKVCSSHSEPSQCCACQRFVREDGLMDLEDRGRRLCGACVRTVVVDSDDAAPLWASVLDFMDRHGLFGDVHPSQHLQQQAESWRQRHRRRMGDIPVLIVPHDALNDPGVVCSSSHGRNQQTTRGLCLYEYHSNPLLGVGYLPEYLRQRGSRRGGSDTNNVWNRVADGLSAVTGESRVTAILCLKGLPADLVASILAHEATHAWLKLHPSYDPVRTQIPTQVEEGCCQLMASLYLSERMEREDGSFTGSESSSDPSMQQQRYQDGPSDRKLRQYFNYCIETDTSEIYGDGFRMASAAYANHHGCSISCLLEHVVQHQSFIS